MNKRFSGINSDPSIKATEGENKADAITEISDIQKTSLVACYMEEELLDFSYCTSTEELKQVLGNDRFELFLITIDRIKANIDYLQRTNRFKDEKKQYAQQLRDNNSDRRLMENMAQIDRKLEQLDIEFRSIHGLAPNNIQGIWGEVANLMKIFNLAPAMWLNLFYPSCQSESTYQFILVNVLNMAFKKNEITATIKVGPHNTKGKIQLLLENNEE